LLDVERRCIKRFDIIRHSDSSHIYLNRDSERTGIDFYPYGAAQQCRYRQNPPRGLPRKEFNMNRFSEPCGFPDTMDSCLRHLPKIPGNELCSWFGLITAFLDLMKQ